LVQIKLASKKFNIQDLTPVAREDFPWFKDAPIGRVLHVEEPSPGHFYWPELDVDVGLEAIKHPEKFPLKAQ